ncbi:molybdate ABC transporter substrate-binding protein [Desulfuribacillus stibiiarsenatis]|uniref:Molybdate ABC transporter substrate-binding protein n=1 Tax=Desulfuribacillus stibiiarsenatis TaxID=1390249 RepID=A0A1E5L4B3_9FIRM|nr:molybdate ABC transporter substrate-binding protein [Desulfuribacillus stibiiarsenatis]OEH84955.1 molybdate ABC transporter substrate-binding protein [Desulfuribacillus stibiiarsenatis]
MKRIIRLFLIVSVFFTFIIGCGKTTTPAPNVAPNQQPNKAPVAQELMVAGAADLTLAFTELGMSFEQKYGTKVTFSFGSSGQLADQIENGAPFDVIASANVKLVDKLREIDRVIADSQELYALGRVGIATLKTNSLQATTLEDLTKAEFKKIAIANPEHAPYGLAAKQAMETAGVWNAVKPKLVYGKNISDTLTLLETGNVEVAIIALSIVKDDVNFRIIDESLHKPLEQSIAVVKGSKNEEMAREFIRYVNGEGRDIMKKYGFIHPILDK